MTSTAAGSRLSPSPLPRWYGFVPALAAVVILHLSACGPRSDPASDAPADTAAWSLDTTRVRIGGTEEERESALAGVFGALVLGDGRFAVGSSASGEVRFYGADGGYLDTSGREGSGPGEFRSVSWMARGLRDSILVFDLRLQRLTVLDSLGAFVRSLQLQGLGGPVRPLGVFPDGALAFAREQHFDPRGASGTIRDTIEVLKVAPTGELLGAIGRFPGSEWLRYRHPASFRTTKLAFGTEGFLAVSGEYLAYGSSETNRLRIYDPAGVALRSIQLPARARRLGEGELSAYLGDETQDRVERDAVLRHLEGRGAVTAPMIADVKGDGEGNLWVRLFPLREGTPSKWIVLSPEGRLVGSLLMAPGAVPLDIQRSSVLLRETTADGVEQVVLRAIVR